MGEPATDIGKDLEIIENGLPIRPDEVTISRAQTLQWIMTAGLLSQMVKVRKLLEQGQFDGYTDRLNLAALPVQNVYKPNPPFVSVFIINYGPDFVEIAINRFSPALEIRPNQTRMIDFSRAKTRISEIYYQAPNGPNALFCIEGVW